MSIPFPSDKPVQKDATVLPRGRGPNTKLVFDRLDPTVAGNRLYLVQVSLGEEGVTGWLHLLHAREIQPEQFDVMLEEAMEQVIKLRIVPRRQGLSQSRTPIENPTLKNEECFDQDLKFLEAVLCDRFGFKIMKPNERGPITMPPTVIVPKS